MEVMFSSALVCLFVCSFVSRIVEKNYSTDFYEIQWPRKNPLDFGSNPDHVTLGFRVKVHLWLPLGGGTAIIRMGNMCYAVRTIAVKWNENKFTAVIYFILF